MLDISDSEIIEYIKRNNATTRETAKHFGISRQTVTNRIRNSKDKETQNIMYLHYKFKSKTKYLKKDKNIIKKAWQDKQNVL